MYAWKDQFGSLSHQISPVLGVVFEIIELILSCCVEARHLILRYSIANAVVLQERNGVEPLFHVAGLPLASSLTWSAPCASKAGGPIGNASASGEGTGDPQRWVSALIMKSDCLFSLEFEM